LKSTRAAGEAVGKGTQNDFLPNRKSRRPIRKGWKEESNKTTKKKPKAEALFASNHKRRKGEKEPRCIGEGGTEIERASGRGWETAVCRNTEGGSPTGDSGVFFKMKQNKSRGGGKRMRRLTNTAGGGTYSPGREGKKKNIHRLVGTRKNTREVASKFEVSCLADNCKKWGGRLGK